MPTTLITAYAPVLIADTSVMSRDEWLELRRKGIGGSDAAAALGLSPYCTTRELFYDKTGVKPAAEDETNWVAKEVGNLLEDLVAQIFSMKTKLKVTKAQKMYAHPLYPFMLADPDYIVEMPDGTNALLDCKTGNYNTQDKWADGTLPVHYELQGRHYMSVMNINTIFFACLFGNNENEFVYRRIDRDMDYESEIIAQEKYFWNEYVLKNIEPPYTEDGDMVIKSIKRHYGKGDKSAEAVEFSEEFSRTLDKIIELREQKLDHDHKSKALENEMKKLYAPIIDIMGVSCDGKCVSGNTAYIVSYKPSYRKDIKKEDLERLEKLRPDIYGEYAGITEFRTFSVTKKEIA